MYSDPRDATFEELYKIACNDSDVMMLTADTGARKFKDFQANIPDQFLNVGIAEQNIMSVAAGLSAVGKKVFVFGIGTFMTTRCYEHIKIDICTMKRAVTIIGMSTGYGYASDGPTHHVIEDVAIMRALPNMTIWSPSDCVSTADAINKSYASGTPNYMRFDKEIRTPIYDDGAEICGVQKIRSGSDLAIVATSIMTSRGLSIAGELEQKGINASVIDVTCLKPMRSDILVSHLSECSKVVTLEEHTIFGGLGSIVCQSMAEHGILKPIKQFGIPDTFHSDVGSRQYICSLDGIDNASILEGILKWI